MNTVYIDQNQAERFNAPYFDGGRLVVAADALLNSKGGCGYDAEHTALLTGYGQATLVLNRLERDRPGSWTIEFCYSAESSLLSFGRSEAYTGKQNLDIGEDIEFTYNGKARQGKVVVAPKQAKTGNTVCRVECVGDGHAKTFTVDKMEFELC